MFNGKISEKIAELIKLLVEREEKLKQILIQLDEEETQNKEKPKFDFSSVEDYLKIK